MKDAVVSGFTGTSRPANLQAGGYWVDTTNGGSPNFYWIYKIYDGTDDIEVFRVNLQTNASSISGADSSFQIQKISADAVGAILKMAKERIATNGQVLSADVLSEIQSLSNDQLGGNPITIKIKTVALENHTTTAQGTALVFEAIAATTATLAEVMRIMNGFLGLGTVAPEASLHVKGSTGIINERATEDAVGPLIVFQKKRLSTDNGAADSGDVIGRASWKSQDNIPNKIEVAAVEVTAAEDHTTTAQGSILRVYTKKTGETALTQHMQFGNVIESKTRHDLNALKLISEDIATAASIAQLTASKAIVNMTGSTATNIHGILAASTTQVVVIHNGSTAAVTLKHQSGTATAADRFDLPEDTDIEILPDASAELFYHLGSSRWKVKSGSGSGAGGGYKVTSVQTIAGGGTVTTSSTDYRQLRHVQGTTTPTTLSTTPFGAGPWRDGAEILLVGNSDAASVIIPYNDASNGVVGNFGESFELGLYQTAKLVYSASLARFIKV